MAERRKVSSLKEQEKGKGKAVKIKHLIYISDDDDDDDDEDQTMAPPQENHKSKFEGGEISLEETPDETEPMGPGSRFLPPDAYCFTKTLNPLAVAPEHARLYIHPHEALAMGPRLAENSSDSNPRTVRVFDALDRQWDMLLSGCTRGRKAMHKLAGGWKDFVLTHNLKDGDEITFYKNSDTSISDDHYYVIKITKRIQPVNLQESLMSGWVRKKPRT